MELGSDAPRPGWAVPEIAWFLALLGGLLATWAGSMVGVAGLGAMLAAAFATFYSAALHRRRLHGAAGMVSCAAILGVMVGAIGLVLEVGWSRASGFFPLAELYVESAIEPLYVGGRRLGAASWAQTGVAAGAAFVALALARPTRGLAPLALAAVAAGALGIAAPHAAEGGVLEEPTVILSLHSLPPWALLQLVGVVLIASALASEEPLLPLDEVSRPRRRLIQIGGPALGLGLLLQPFLAVPWGVWVPVP